MARPEFPNLNPDDAAVWRKFLLLYPDRYNLLTYDVKVGPQLRLDPSTDAMDEKICAALTRRRIDVVGYTDTEVHILEITTDAGLKAVGQCLTYPVLWLIDNPTPKPVRPVLVCDRLRLGIKEALAHWKVEAIVLDGHPTLIQPR